MTFIEYCISAIRYFINYISGISPLSISLLGALVLVGGIEGWVVLTSEGVSILSIPQEWVWALAPSPSFNNIVSYLNFIR